jgi:CAAX protease family protein
MRPLRALAIYIAVVFLGGALLAPWLYWGAQHLADSLPGLAKQPFHRFVNRSMYVLALAGLWPLLKNLGATSPKDAGLVKPAGQGRKLAAGFLLGFLSLAIVAALALTAGARITNPNLTAAKLAERLLGAALSAVVVAVLEEILFRGGVFGGLRRVFDWRFALAISSMIYAIVHFLAPVKDPEAVTWTSGLGQLALMLGGFADWQQIFPGFINLTLAGALLGLAYQRTGNLYFSIGLHAGWIFWLKSYGFLTRETAGANTWWWGTAKLINGWVALPVLLAALFLFTRLPLARQGQRPP